MGFGRIINLAQSKLTNYLTLELNIIYYCTQISVKLIKPMQCTHVIQLIPGNFFALYAIIQHAFENDGVFGCIYEVTPRQLWLYYMLYHLLLNRVTPHTFNISMRNSTVAVFHNYFETELKFKFLKDRHKLFACFV